MQTMMERAKTELTLAGLYEEDSDYSGGLGRAAEELYQVFTDQGHSGMSASVTANIFHALANGQVLSPLTGEPAEWKDVSEEMGRPLFQNKRMGSVFAEDDHGKNATYSEGRIFVDKEGIVFSCNDSTVPVEFPCIPKTEYIHEGTPEAEPFRHVFKD